MNIIETKTYDFKTNFSSYVSALKSGKADKIIILNRDEPIGEFKLLEKKKKTPLDAFGIWKGELTDEEIAEAFDPEFEAELASYWNKD